MKTLAHAIVWIDHAQARVTRFDSETAETRVIHPAGGTPHLHHKANSMDSGRAPEDEHYLHSVGQALKGCTAVLIVGPANEKREFLKHLARHDVELLGLVAAVQTMDHPSDAQLLEHARRHFRLQDPLLAPRAWGSR